MSQKLDQLFDEQRSRAGQLLDVLEQESQAILGADVEQLQSINRDKLSCIESLKATEASWPVQLRGDQANGWIARQNAKTQASWQQLVEVLKQCRRQNDANGLLIAQRQQVVSARLQGGGGQTYGAGGQQVTEGRGRWATSA